MPGKIIAHIAIAPALKATKAVGLSSEPERTPSKAKVATATTPNVRYSSGDHFLISRLVIKADTAMTPKNADETTTGLS
jgi:hypothetical protein